MELISAAGMETFLASDKNVFNFDHEDDSGLSSSPSSPQSGGYDSASQLFDFEESLQSDFLSSLNTCLFDDELPSKLYTHIKIKEEPDDELWASNQATLEHLKEDMFDGISLADSCDFDEQFEIMDKMLNPSVNSKIMSEKTVQSRQDENDSVEVLVEVATNRSTCTKSSTSGNTTAAEDSSPEDSEDGTCKRNLRKRVNTVYADHDYIKLSDEAGDKAESDDDGLYEKVELVEEDDEEFRPSCSSAKKSRLSKNSKNPKAGKDQKYWERRKRNNLAAKRSREAKRAREIETAKRTAALEKENTTLKNQVKKLKAAIQKAEKRLRIMV